jgi:predicted metal-dependent HD superfamily phosphohydrolase
MDLRAHFLSFAKAHTEDAFMAERWWRDVSARYAEPHRHYHTLEHVAHMVELLPHASETIRAAVWFHDAIYGGGASEQRSAALAREALTDLAWPSEEIHDVERMIIATTTHDSATLPPDHHAFLDADLAILGSPIGRYRQYVDQVREEYRHVPDDLFRSTRAGILRRFLARPHIYVTAEFFSQFEAQARVNLAWELSELSPSP